MTATAKEHRQRRYRMAVAYLNRHAELVKLGRPAHVTAYREWVDAFPRFMLIAYPGAILRERAHDERHKIRAADHATKGIGATPLHDKGTGHGRDLRQARDARPRLQRAAKMGLRL